MFKEPPTFHKRLDETTVMMRRSGKLECRITGEPTPTIKWFKNWQPLSASNRIKMTFAEPDVYMLQLNEAIAKDAGLYSCSAVNIAGHASSSANITIEGMFAHTSACRSCRHSNILLCFAESEDRYDLLTYKKPYVVKPRSRPIEDYYDIGDEIGRYAINPIRPASIFDSNCHSGHRFDCFCRGTQGVVYHAVNRDTGKSYAAKTMRGTGKFREWMDNEMDIMHQLNHPRLVRLCDAFDTDKSLSLVTDLYPLRAWLRLFSRNPKMRFIIC